MLFFLCKEGEIVDWEYLSRKEAIALNKNLTKSQWLAGSEILERYEKEQGILKI